MLNRPCGACATVLRSRQVRRDIPGAFTLIELLVVISVIALLIALLLPALEQAQKMTKLAMCAAHQRQLAVAVHAYAGDEDGELPGRSNYGNTMILFDVTVKQGLSGVYSDYPTGPGFAALHPGYIDDKNVFYCPQNNLYQWDRAPWSRTLINIPWWAESQGNRDREIGYFYLGNRLPEWNAPAWPGGPPPDDRNLPTSIADPGSWELWADRNESSDGVWTRGNHPGFYEYTSRGFINPPGIEPEGTNVARLDGSVAWRTLGEMDQLRYPYSCGLCWVYAW